MKKIEDKGLSKNSRKEEKPMKKEEELNKKHMKRDAKKTDWEENKNKENMKKEKNKEDLKEKQKPKGLKKRMTESTTLLAEQFHIFRIELLKQRPLICKRNYWVIIRTLTVMKSLGKLMLIIMAALLKRSLLTTSINQRIKILQAQDLICWLNIGQMEALNWAITILTQACLHGVK